MVGYISAHGERYWISVKNVSKVLIPFLNGTEWVILNILLESVKASFCNRILSATLTNKKSEKLLKRGIVVHSYIFSVSQRSAEFKHSKITKQTFSKWESTLPSKVTLNKFGSLDILLSM